METSPSHYTEKNFSSAPDQKKKRSREHSRGFDFTQWKSQLEAAKSSNQFLESLALVDIHTEEAQHYIFGSNGLLDRFSRGEIDLGEGSDFSVHFDLEEHSFYTWFYRVIGFEMLKEKRNGEKDEQHFIKFIQKLPDVYKKQWSLYLEEAEKEGFPDEGAYNVEEFRTEKEAQLAESDWHSREIINELRDPHEEWDITDYEREQSHDLARRFFEVCKEKKLVSVLPAIFEIAAYTIPTGALNREVVEVCNTVDAHESARILLENIRSKKTSPREKNSAARLLYLLEMGEVEISGGQLEYLSKQYTLEGAKKQEAAAAIRITPDGKLGLLNSKKELIGYIEFGDFGSQKNQYAQIMEISADLFLAKNSLNDQEQSSFEKEKEKFLTEYHKVFFENFILQETHVRINNLSLREQFWFYKFLQSREGDSFKERVVGATRKHGDAFLRVFIALQFDETAGEKILSIAEKFSREEGEEIFGVYSRLTEASDKIEVEMKEFFVQTPVGVEPYKATAEVMKRAGLLLDEFSSVTDPQETGKVLKKVRNVHEDMVVFSALFKTAFKGKKEMGFHQVRDLVFGGKSGLELGAQEKEQMVAMARENYRAEPHVADELEHLLHDEEQLQKNEFIVLSRQTKDGKKLLSFLRAEKRDEERVYIGGFNVDFDLRGSGIGEQMLFNTIQALSKDYTVEAVAVPELVAGTHYVEQVGFVAKKFDMDTEKTGTFYGWFEIEIEKEAAPYSLRTTQKDIQKLYNEKFQGTSPESHIGEPVILAKFDISQDMKACTQLCERLLNHEGYHLVRYLPLDREGKTRLYGFEKAPDKVSAEATLAEVA